MKSILRRNKKPKSKTKQKTTVKPYSGAPVKFGKPILLISFGNIKIVAGVCLVLIFFNVIFAIKLFSSSVKTRNHLGHFLNMISKTDGDVLPTLQALPVLCFFLLNIAVLAILFRLFNAENQPKLNNILYYLLMTILILILTTFVILIVIMNHSLSSREELHSGIVEVMKEYATNSRYKERIDRLQVEFQCCGSKKYDEWYEIQWYDASLVKKGAIDNQTGHTPFSCCSISSSYPCIHHNIERTGQAYLYTPEQNLSISTDGCYTKLQAAKKEVGLIMVGNLILFLTFQSGILICIRFLQTAHSVKYRFVGHRKLYSAWLLGCYKRGVDDESLNASSDHPEST